MNDRFEVMNPWVFGLVERRSTYHRFMAEVYNGVSNEARNLKNQYMEDNDLSNNVMFQSIVPGEGSRLSVRAPGQYRDEPQQQLSLSELKDSGQQGVVLRSSAGIERGSELQLKNDKDFKKLGKGKDAADEDSFQLSEQPYQPISSPNNEPNPNRQQGGPQQQQSYGDLWGQFNANGLHSNNPEQQLRTSAPVQQRQTSDFGNTSGFRPLPAGNSQIRNQTPNSSQKLGDLSTRAKLATDKAQGAMAQNDFLTFDDPTFDKQTRSEPANDFKANSAVQKKHTLNPFENDQDAPDQAQANRGGFQQQSPFPSAQGGKTQQQSNVAMQRPGPFTQGVTNQPY